MEISSKVKKNIISLIEDHAKGIAKTCSELIQIDTTNPPGDCSKLISYLKPRYEAAGAKFRTISADRNYLKKLGHAYPRNNFVAALGGSNSGRPGLAIGTHMDTVPAGESQDWKHPPFSGAIADSKIWGRGAVDAKCSLVAELYAMKAIQDCDVSLGRQFLCIGSVDDEAPNNEISAGMKYVVSEGLQKAGYELPRFAINAEASGLSNIWGIFSGELTLKLGFRGRTAHPPLGRNALAGAFEFWNILNKKRNRAVLSKPPRLVWMSGGSKSEFGTTPEKAEMILRVSISSPRISPRIALNEIRRIIREERQKREQAFEIEEFSVLSEGRAFNVGEDSSLVGAIKMSAKEVGLKSSYGGGLVGPGDLQFFLGRGIQGVTFGAGSLDRCHVPNEYVTIKELVAQTKIYALTAYQLCSS